MAAGTCPSTSQPTRCTTSSASSAPSDRSACACAAPNPGPSTHPVKHTLHAWLRAPEVKRQLSYPEYIHTRQQQQRLEPIFSTGWREQSEAAVLTDGCGGEDVAGVTPRRRAAHRSWCTRTSTTPRRRWSTCQVSTWQTATSSCCTTNKRSSPRRAIRSGLGRAGLNRVRRARAVRSPAREPRV
jgi:hypothetical protein